MNFLRGLYPGSRFFYFLLAILSLLGRFSNMAVLMLLNLVVGGKTLLFHGRGDVFAFFGLMVFSFFSAFFLQNYMTRLANTSVAELELSLIDKVRRSKFDAFRELGNERIYTAIGDTGVIKEFPAILVFALNCIICTLCSVGKRKNAARKRLT